LKSQDEPDRLSHEGLARWTECHARQHRESRQHQAAHRWAEILDDAERFEATAAKLRQAAKDAARVEDLRDALDFATSGLALILADVRLGIRVDADILDLRTECLKALKENADE
tara:strand:- start:890 stop:1231 length:342 start_codon:yes stop_codon:yes gene_type:complete